MLLMVATFDQAIDTWTGKPAGYIMRGPLIKSSIVSAFVGLLPKFIRQAIFDFYMWRAERRLRKAHEQMARQIGEALMPTMRAWVDSADEAIK